MTVRTRLGLSVIALAALLAPARGLAQESAAPAVTRDASQETPRYPGTGPLSRLGRGLVNMLISPLEIPATMVRVGSEHNPVFGFIGGPLEGLGNGLVRFGAGALETLTFFIPSDRLPLYNKRLGERALPPLRPPTQITRP